MGSSERTGTSGRRGLHTMAAVVLLLSLAACSSDNDTADTAASTSAAATAPSAAETAASDPEAETVPPTDATTDTTTDATTDATTDESGDTTDATTDATDVPTTPATVASTTTASATPDVFPRGWQPVDLFTDDVYFPDNVFPPFEQSNWIGTPSPALPGAPGQPLADGLYSISVEWDPAASTTLAVEVFRLDLCSGLPEFSCIAEDEPFQPDEVGVDRAAHYSMTVPLDGSIGTALIGFHCDGTAAVGNGADMASLLIAFDEAYQRTLAPQIEGGADQFDVIDAIAAAPTDGFSGANTECPDLLAGGLVFRSGDAPPILLQIISKLDDANQPVLVTPTEIIQAHTVRVVDGAMTFYWYAGFLS